nr:MAG TPA: hypothetical protein [Caudoviricetes sp.]
MVGKNWAKIGQKYCIYVHMPYSPKCEKMA